MLNERDNLQGLTPMDQLDYLEIADGEPDPRGWDVISADGCKIGEVDQLLVDTAAMKVRYLDVDVDEKDLDLNDEDRHLLVPIGFARLDEDDKHVVVDGLQSSQLGSMTGRVDLANWGGREIGRDFDETRTRGIEGRDDLSDRNEIRIPRTEEDLQIGKREAKAGEVDVHTRVDTEHVSRPVELRHEEVEVERRPVEGGMRAGSFDTREDEIRVPVVEEEAVVAKRPVVRDEIVLRKRQVEDTQNVEADLRRERIDIEPEGDIKLRDDETRRNH